MTTIRSSSEWRRIDSGLKKGLGVALLLIAVCIASGCHTIAVYSEPAGARVLVNGVDIGRSTPTKIKVRNLNLGRSYITVEKEGYRTETKKQAIDVRVSVGAVAFAWFPPVLIKQLCDNMFKGITYPPRRHLEEFILVEDPPKSRGK